MADSAVTRTQPPRDLALAWRRLKTNRNWAGFWFMLPAAAFLILFLAYPLVLGVWLLLFNWLRQSKVRRAAQFSGAPADAR